MFLRLFFIILVMTPSFVFASNDSVSNHNIKPVVLQNANIQIKFQDSRNQSDILYRLLGIHRAAQSGGIDTSNIYFHKPILALIETDKQQGKWPKVVHMVHERKSGTYLEIRMLASSGKIVSKAKEVISKSDASWLSNNKIDPTSVRVIPWPTDAVSLKLIDRVDQAIAYASDTRRIPSSGREVWTLYLKLLKDAKEVQDAMIKNTLDLEVALSYAGVEELSGRSFMQIDQRHWDKLKSDVDSIQKESNRPLFQEEFIKIKQAFESLVVSVIAVQDPELTKLLISDIQSKIFDQPQKIKLGDANDISPIQLRDYLKPLLKKIEKEKIDETTTTEDNKIEVSADFGWQQGKPTFKLNPSTLKNIQDKHHIAFKQKESTEVYIPHEVTVRYLRSGWLNSVINSVSYAFIAKQKSQGYKYEDIIKLSFTSDKIPQFIDDSSDYFVGTPLGSISFYIGAGNNPPPGFEWLDEKGRFPNEAWVPKHLRNQLLPNLNQKIPVGTNDTQMLGTTINQGHLNVKIGLNNKTKNVDNWDNNGSIIQNIKGRKDGQSDFHENYDTHGPPSGTLHIGMRSTMDIEFHKLNRPTYFKTESAKGEVSISNPSQYPPHIKGRWIIRVR